MRLLGGRPGPPIRMSMSAGVMYWVPAIHCRFEIVGRGGASLRGSYRRSADGGSGWLAPQTEASASSAGPVNPTMSPEVLITASDKRLASNV